MTGKRRAQAGPPRPPRADDLDSLRGLRDYALALSIRDSGRAHVEHCWSESTGILPDKTFQWSISWNRFFFSWSRFSQNFEYSGKFQQIFQNSGGYANCGTNISAAKSLAFCLRIWFEYIDMIWTCDNSAWEPLRTWKILIKSWTFDDLSTILLPQIREGSV